MNEALAALIRQKGDTQTALAKDMGISLARLNAKIRGWRGAEFTQSEIRFIARRYGMTADEIKTVFIDETTASAN